MRYSTAERTGKAQLKRRQVFDIEATCGDDDDEDDQDYEERSSKRMRFKRTRVEADREEEDVEVEDQDEEEDGEDEVEDDGIVLWKIKCKKGLEELSASELRNRRPPSIKNVFCVLPSQTGAIFVQGEADTDLDQACRYLSGVKGRPKKEVIKKRAARRLLEGLENPKLRAGDWVEVKSSNHKGELAQVVQLNLLKEAAAVKLVPRLSDTMTTSGRNPPKLLTFKDLEDRGLPVRKRINDGLSGYAVRSFFFMDGYLVKSFPFDSLERIPNPDADAIDLFQNGSGPTEDAPLPAAAMRLCKGDKVLIVGGKHINEIGTVRSKDQSSLSINLPGKDYPVRVHESRARKFYEVGDEATVAHGDHKGESGVITSVEDGEVVIQARSGETISVKAEYIGRTSLVPHALNKLGSYCLHDLVSFNQEECGVIIRISSNWFQVLKGAPDKHQLQTCRPMEVTKVVDKFAVARDSAGNPIRLRNMVRVDRGTHKGKEGEARHIYKDVIFLRTIENDGFSCVRASSCTVLGVETARRGVHKMKGKEVRVTKGVFKGYRGRVHVAFSGVAHVFLEANLRTVAVEIEHLKDLSEPASGDGEAWATDGDPAGAEQDRNNADEGDWNTSDVAPAAADTDGGWGDGDGDRNNDAANTATEGMKNGDAAAAHVDKEDGWNTAAEEDGWNTDGLAALSLADDSKAVGQDASCTMEL